MDASICKWLPSDDQDEIMKLILNTIKGRWSILSLVLDGSGWALFVFALSRFALAFSLHSIDIASV